jgi:hypothetical protein
MPQYSKTAWVDGSAPAISAANLNKLEQGVFDSLRQDGSTTMSAQLVTIAGSAATPAIAPTGDSNTGIFFPAADTIAFGEGGAEAMRINSSGNVGIGTDAPSSRLTIRDSSPRVTLESNTNGNNIGYKFNALDSGGSTKQAGLYFQPNTSSNSYLSLSADDASDHLVVKATGNVGIGTTSPSTKLHVQGDLRLSATSGNVGVGFVSDGLDASIYGNDADNSLRIYNTQDRMTITSAGRVGIGTTAPDVILHLKDTTTPTIAFEDASANKGYVDFNSTRMQLHGGSGAMYFVTGSSEKMRITSAGNVGIGTTSPDVFSRGYSGTILGISSSGQSAIELNSGTGNTCYFDLGVAGTRTGSLTATSTDVTLGTIGAIPLNFSTNGSVKAAITSAGNVGIGTTSPSAKMQIDGSDNSFNPIQIINNTNTGINAYSYTEWQSNNGTNKLQIGIYSTNDGKDAFISNAAGSNIRFESGTGAGAEKMRLTAAGYLLIGYTTSNGAYPLQVNGQIFATSSTIATSDGRYKKDVVSLDGALNIVAALNPVQFSWKDHPVHKFNTEVPTIGFIAQEVAEVLKDKAYLTSVIKKSECTWETETGETVEREITRDVETQVEREVIEEVDGEEIARTITETVIEQVTETISEPVKEVHTEEFYGIAESNMIAILTKAIQELNAKVTALEAQLAK